MSDIHTNKRENLANLAKLLSAFEVVLVNENKVVRIRETESGMLSINSLDSLVNLIETGQKAMIELAEFTKSYEAQAFRATQLISKLMESIEVLKLAANGTISKKEIEAFLGTPERSNVVPFALEGTINPEQA